MVENGPASVGDYMGTIHEAADALTAIKSEVEDLRHARACRDQWKAQAESLHNRLAAVREWATHSRHEWIRSEIVAILEGIQPMSAPRS